MEKKFNLELMISEELIMSSLRLINVVCGVNASGKLTASKLLYCFLKPIQMMGKSIFYLKLSVG